MSDFFVDDDEQQTDTKPFNPQNKATTTGPELPPEDNVPPEYIRIDLSSVGKLDAPIALHVRDYNGKDLMDLGLTSEEDMLRGLVGVLNNLIWEDFDARYLTEEELIEVMLNIYVNFWSPTIQGYPFPYTDEEWNSLDDERKDRINKGLEKLEVDINIASQIETKPLPEEFREPLVVNGPQHKVAFRLPRVGHYFVAEDYVNEKYATEDQKHAALERKIRENAQSDTPVHNIPPKQLQQYRQYTRSRNSEYIMAKQAQTIVAFDGKDMESIEEQLETYSHIDLKLWRALNDYVDNTLTFGINPDVEMTSPIDGTTTVRRCRFRPMDFIPPIQLQDSGEYSIQFGNE